MTALLALMLLRSDKDKPNNFMSAVTNTNINLVQESSGNGYFKCRLHQFTMRASLADFRLSGTDIRGKEVHTPNIPIDSSSYSTHDEFLTLIFLRLRGSQLSSPVAPSHDDAGELRQPVLQCHVSTF